MKDLEDRLSPGITALLCLALETALTPSSLLEQPGELSFALGST